MKTKKHYDPLVLAKYGILQALDRNSGVYPQAVSTTGALSSEQDLQFLQGYACLATGIYKPIGKAERVLAVFMVPDSEIHRCYSGVPWRHRN